MALKARMRQAENVFIMMMMDKPTNGLISAARDVQQRTNELMKLHKPGKCLLA